jgi:asparagine synthase (glutamine-hydrolysing)
MGVLAREARKSVKVVLSGEGADEILGGYMFHRKLAQIEALRSLLPRAAWPAAASLVNVLPAGLLGAAFDYPGELGGEGRRKIASLLRQIGKEPLPSLYRSAISLFDPEDVAEACAGGPLAALAASVPGPQLDELKDASVLRRLIDFQYSDWLADDILTKADKMTMAHSLECRIPFMDEAVIMAAAALSDRQKLGRFANKFALRRFARGLLPRAVVDGPKRAFYIPLESYIETPQLRELIDWALAPERLRRRGLISPEWAARQQAPGSSAGFLPLKRLFSVLMLELWFESFAPDASWA